MSFKDILTQDKAKAIITGQLRSGRIPHAYLFLGPDGVGRKKTALELAKALNCRSLSGTTDKEQCDHCISCQKVDHGIHPDVQLIDFAYQARLENKEPEKQKTMKIDTIRALQHEVNLKPTESTWKIFIVEPAEKITLDAANCLLKTLEEPPKWTVIILLAKHKENLPATIVSRTQIIPFRPLSEKDIAGHLMAKCGLDWTQALDIARMSEGSLAQAFALIGDRESVQSTFWARLKDGPLTAPELLADSQEYAREAAKFLDELLAEAKSDFREDPEQYRAPVEHIL
jgi:DNA polymerase-3 subunit delta'